MRGQLPALEALAFNWGDAYVFSYVRDRWVALRRDNHRFITADTLAGLGIAIEADYENEPVPRECDPSGAADYLDADDGDDDIPDDDDPDAERLTVLRELQTVFPLWAITYSGQMRAWIARTRGKTICENSAVLLCMALALIERRERQAENSADRDWPPWGNMSPP